MRGQLTTGVIIFLAASAATAGELKVSVSDKRGKPVADAVVTVSWRPGSAAVPAPARRTKTINQVALTFVPYLQVFRPGDKVLFHNSDRTRHHVYAFSPVKSFEFVLNPGESSPPLELDKVGVVAVGCNIHDPMITYLFVSDAPWMVRTGADGVAAFAELPAGTYDVRAWQPRLRPGGVAPAKPVVIDAKAQAGPISFSLNLLPDPRRRASHEHSGY